MATIGATTCSVGMGLHKNIKNWREAVKYLPSVDRAKFLKRNSSVLTLDIVPLKKEMEEKNAGQWQRQMFTVECSKCGVAHSSHL